MNFRALIRFIPWLAPFVAAGGLALALCWQDAEPLTLGFISRHARIGLDPTGRTFLLFSSILWLCSAIYGLGYLKSDPRRYQYHGFFLFALLGNLGLIVARDAVTFYTCFALMSFSSFGLVLHNRDEAAARAGKVYLILVIIGEVSLFSAVAGLVAGNGMNLSLPVEAGLVTRSLTLPLLIVGFGIKAGVVGLHVWLPLAHPAAPPPASAVLSGAMIKAGLLGWIRFLPLGEVGFESWGTGLMVAGLVSAFFGVAVGMVQVNPKTILAYSSISQMGFMTLAIGAGLVHPKLWPSLLVAVSVYALHHGLAKGALFLGAGAAPGGLNKFAWWGLLLPALSLGGAPFLSGAVAKAALKYYTPKFSGDWPSVLAWLLPLAALGTTLLMVRFLLVVKHYHPAAQTDKDRRWMFVGWGLLVLCTLSLVWMWEPASYDAKASLKAAKLLKAAWPVLAGLAVGWAFIRFKWGRAVVGRIPAGDVLVWVERMIPRSASTKPPVHPHSDHVEETPSLGSRPLFQVVQRAEARLGGWSTATLLLLVIVILLVGFATVS